VGNALLRAAIAKFSRGRTLTTVDPDRLWKSEVMHNDLVRVGVPHLHLGDPLVFQP